MKEHFDVTGMSCSACSARVEKAVKALNGIDDVNVNLLKNSMVVDFDPTKTGTEQIEDAVKKQDIPQSSNLKKEAREQQLLLNLRKTSKQRNSRTWKHVFGFLSYSASL